MDTDSKPMKFQVHIPFVAALGFELLRFENGEAEIAMTPREEHMNSWSVVHGGVTMTLSNLSNSLIAFDENGTPYTDSAATTAFRFGANMAHRQFRITTATCKRF